MDARSLGQSGQNRIEQSTISQNKAVLGAGVYAQGLTDVVHSTVTRNETSSIGGGIFIAAGTLVLNHTIIARNLAPLDRDVTGAIGVSLDAHFSLIGDGSGSGLAPAPIGSPDANGNLIGGPVHGVIDPLLGPLADNGGFELPDGSRILTHALLAGESGDQCGGSQCGGRGRGRAGV